MKPNSFVRGLAWAIVLSALSACSEAESPAPRGASLSPDGRPPPQRGGADGLVTGSSLPLSSEDRAQVQAYLDSLGPRLEPVTVKIDSGPDRPDRDTVMNTVRPMPMQKGERARFVVPAEADKVVRQVSDNDPAVQQIDGGSTSPLSVSPGQAVAFSAEDFPLQSTVRFFFCSSASFRCDISANLTSLTFVIDRR